MLSSFSLVSLLGVLLGVTVLIVVMAVYAGMEREMKSRLLSFTPHLLLQSEGAVADWQKTADAFRHHPGVESATAFVNDNVVIDVDGVQRPVQFRGVDTSDAQQVEGIRNLFDLKVHPDSSADMGIDDRVVISSIIADQIKMMDDGKLRSLRVGDAILLYSTRNFGEVMKAYKSTEKPPLREAFKAPWDQIKTVIGEGWDDKGGKGYQLAKPRYDEAYTLLLELLEKPLREPELARLAAIVEAMDTSTKDEATQSFQFTQEGRQSIRELVAETDVADAEKMDGEVLKRLKNLVLPKEVKVIGIYQASQMAATPDLFVPLPLAQDLSGLDDKVMGIALRLHEPYAAAAVAKEVAGKLTSDWNVITWMEQYQQFFSLISQQRVMMYFALSFIVLVAAFSMMAVMFTVTILKRREIGVMKALGASSGQIVRVFLYQGMLLGAVGSVLGLGLGRLVILFRGPLQDVLRLVGLDPFPSSFYAFQVLPAYNEPKEQAIIVIAAFVLCALAATVPAFFASRSDAAKSLRNL